MVAVKLDFSEQKDDILCFTLAKDAEYYNGDYQYIGRIMGVSWGGCDTPTAEKYEKGISLIEKHKCCGIYFQFPREFFWNFVNNHSSKEQYDFILFRAFQALKTIVGDKPYCNVTNEYWMARMCGCVSVKEFEQQYLFNGKVRKAGKNREITKYYSNYYLRILRDDLEKTYNGVKFLKLPRNSGVHGFYCTMQEHITREDMAKMIVEDNERKKKTKRENERDIDNAKAMAILNKAYKGK